MAKEKFLIVAKQFPDDCFSRFSETANKAAIDAGTADETDPYSWIEASFEFCLVRYREATHLCSFTPSAYAIPLQNFFVGVPNALWDDEGDPDGLEMECEPHGDYYGYQDEYDPRFIAETFTIDTMKDMDGLRRPSDNRSEEGEAYHQALWSYAEDAAREMMRNELVADICNVFTFRKWDRARLEAARKAAAERSKGLAAHSANVLTLR